MPKHPVVLLRPVVLAEACSYALLAFVAMPLKYVWGRPLAVSVVGMVHGVLFLIGVWLLVRARVEARWPGGRIAAVFLASLVPIVPFFLDRRMRRWAAEATASGGTP